MARQKRQFTTFNLSFLDIMSCGFGAVVLVFLIIDHSIEVEKRDLNQDLLSEVNLLEEDVTEGEAGLVRLRNTLSELDLQMVEAQGRASRILDETREWEALIEDLERDGRQDIAAWLPDGKAFRINNPDVFSKKIMPNYFRQTKFPATINASNLPKQFEMICSSIA